METILFASAQETDLAKKICAGTNTEQGMAEWHRFPDGESLVRIKSQVENKHVLLLYRIDGPDEKFLQIYFFARTCNDLGALKITLVAPYLPYMRQDKVFNPGEGITSVYFASLISSAFDSVVTIEPHLHRWTNLEELYDIECNALHCDEEISNYIQRNIDKPVIIGPDSESSQWVKTVSENCSAPYLVLEKKRQSDHDVEIIIPGIEEYKEHTPVLVDDIISTGGTMLKVISNLKMQTDNTPWCIGIHGIFAGDAYRQLLNTGAYIITTNTVMHESNKIDVLSKMIL